MITLTTPALVKTVLGSSSNTSYDRLDLTTIQFDVVNKGISGQCALIASATPQAANIIGSYNIPTSGSAIMTVTIPSLPFYASIALTTTQQTTVQGWVQQAQNLVEGGFVSVGVVAGTQATGS